MFMFCFFLFLLLLLLFVVVVVVIAGGSHFARVFAPDSGCKDSILFVGRFLMEVVSVPWMEMAMIPI